jgi:hypothetical protein
MLSPSSTTTCGESFGANLAPKARPTYAAIASTQKKERGLGWRCNPRPRKDIGEGRTGLLRGAAAHGIATFDDQNAVLLEGDGGAAITNVRIRDRRRRNIPSDYLYPIMHQPNL